MSGKRYILTVNAPTPTFEAYWYGYGTVIHDNGATVVVDYGDDKYRAEIQCTRFWSGLYFAEVTEVEHG